MTRILHVASFVGNIGDNASHQGFYTILDSLLNDYEVETLEIRRFYKKYKNPDKKCFDKDFVDYANTFDFLVIGGGGFLDYWVEGSATGTTLDIEPDLLAQLNVPTLITSVGCIPHQIVPLGNVEKFRIFLDKILENPKISLFVRNDGSVTSLRDEVGVEYLNFIPEVLDNGFFYESNTDYLMPMVNYVAINITDDQLSMYSKSRESIDTDLYHRELAKVIRHIVLVKKMNVVMVPHIHGDLIAISRLFSYLDDLMIRESISVAPCIQGDKGADFIFGLYKHSEFVLASRYHANVCNLAISKTTFGLGVLDRVRYLYDQLHISEMYVDMSGCYSEQLIRKIDNHKANCANSELAELKINTINLYADFFEQGNFA